MHLEYEAGDMIMIDFAGKKLGYVHPDTKKAKKSLTIEEIGIYSGY